MAPARSRLEITPADGDRSNSAAGNPIFSGSPVMKGALENPGRCAYPRCDGRPQCAHRINNASGYIEGR
ncbi:hypothetical protein VPH35_123933 [Triticum aestivum]